MTSTKALMRRSAEEKKGPVRLGDAIKQWNISAPTDGEAKGSSGINRKTLKRTFKFIDEAIGTELLLLKAKDKINRPTFNVVKLLLQESRQGSLTRSATTRSSRTNLFKLLRPHSLSERPTVEFSNYLHKDSQKRKSIERLTAELAKSIEQARLKLFASYRLETTDDIVTRVNIGKHHILDVANHLSVDLNSIVDPLVAAISGFRPQKTSEGTTEAPNVHEQLFTYLYFLSFRHFAQDLADIIKRPTFTHATRNISRELTETALDLIPAGEIKATTEYVEPFDQRFISIEGIEAFVSKHSERIRKLVKKATDMAIRHDRIDITSRRAAKILTIELIRRRKHDCLMMLRRKEDLQQLLLEPCFTLRELIAATCAAANIQKNRLASAGNIQGQSEPRRSLKWALDNVAGPAEMLKKDNVSHEKKQMLQRSLVWFMETLIGEQERYEAVVKLTTARLNAYAAIFGLNDIEQIRRECDRFEMFCKVSTHNLASEHLHHAARN